MTKDERQLICVNKWREANGKGTLNLIFRFGKTKVADIIIDKCKTKDISLNLLAVAPSDVTKKNLIKNIGWLDNNNTFTSNQLINYNKEFRNISTGLLILDEVHRFLDGDIYNVIKNINYKYILCLTGVTLTKEQIKKLESLDAPIIDYISEVEAIEQGWIGNFVEYNLPVQLDNEDKIRYNKYTQLISETLEIFKGVSNGVNAVFGNRKIFKSDFDLVLSCFLGQSYKQTNGFKTFIKRDVIAKIVAECQGWSKDLDVSTEYGKKVNFYWNPDNIIERAKTFKSYVTNRNDILIFNRPKINAVISILKRNPVPTICFNESIQMVDELNNLYPKDSIAYHSAIESRYVWDKTTNDIYRTKAGEPKKIGKIGLKKLAIEGMKNGTYNKLFTAKALNEGLTIENIEQVITTGGSVNPQTHENRVARGKTYDYANPNKICTIINLYVDDFTLDIGLDSDDKTSILKTVKSRDKIKLMERQKDSEYSPIWVSDINEIFN